MKLKWRYGWFFPLVLAVGLGGLSAWLGRISEVTVEEVALNPNEPQYEMSGISGKMFDSQGYLKDSLTAERAWQLPKSHDVYLALPDLQLFNAGKGVYQVSSEYALYNTDTRKVSFDEDVVLTKAAEPTRPAGILKTSRLTVDTVSKLAETDAPVHYQYGDSQGTANGLTYDYQQGLLNLPSRVKAIIYEQK